MYSKNVKISYATEQNYQNIQLKEIKFESGSSVAFEATDKLKDEGICIMINGRDDALINYSNTIGNNELYVYLVSKLANPSLIKLLGSSIFEVKDPKNEYITSICEIFLFESKKTFPMNLVVPLRHQLEKHWDEKQLLFLCKRSLALISELYKLKYETKLILDAEHIFYTPETKEFNFWLKPELHFAMEPTRRDILQEKYKTIFKSPNVDERLNEQLLNLLSLVEIITKIMLLDQAIEFHTRSDIDEAMKKGQARYPQVTKILHMIIGDMSENQDERKPLTLDSIQQAAATALPNEEVIKEVDESVLKGRYADRIDQSLLHYHTARCYDSLGLRQVAVEKYTEGLKKFKDSKNHERYMALSIDLANLHLKLKKPKDAEAEYTELINKTKDIAKTSTSLESMYNKARIGLAAALRIQSKSEEATALLNDLLSHADELDGMNATTVIYNLFLLIKTAKSEEKFNTLHERSNNIKVSNEFQKTFLQMVVSIITSEAHKTVTGDIEKSLINYYEGLAQARKIFSGDFHYINTLILISLAEIFKMLGDYQRVFDCLNASMEIRQKIYETYHPEMLLNMERVGLAHEATGSYKESLTLFRKIIQIKKSIYGDKDTMVGVTYNVIGSLYKNLGQKQLALENFERSLEIFESAHGASHQAVATTLNNIGTMHKVMEQNEKALEFYKRAMTMFKELYGPQHNHVATLLNNIGTLNLNLEHFDNAIANYNESLAIYTKNVEGKTHS